MSDETSDDAPCYHCGGPATLLCDFVIAREKAGEQFKEGTPDSPSQHWYPVTTFNSRVFTCDRPLCEACATGGGTLFFCGEAGSIESVDYCRDHADGRDFGSPIVTEAEAEAIRAKLNRPFGIVGGGA